MRVMSKPILCCDFDGVLHSYTSGWKGADVVADPPVEGAIRFLTDASDKFELHIYSSRSHQPGGIAAMHEYLAKHIRRYWTDLPIAAERLISALKFPSEKPPAMITLDDRGLLFDGKFPDIDELLWFKPWNKRESGETWPPVTNDEIRRLALSHGLKVREQDDGRMDLNPYVYDFARTLLQRQ
jgi:hypothetical protein